MSKESISKLIYDLKSIKNEQEKRNAILKAYFFAFHQEKISVISECSFSELSFQDIKDIYSNIVIEDIYNTEYSAENVANRLTIFGFTHLDKFTQSEDEKGVLLVNAEDMPRNFNEEELNFFSLSADVIMEFYQDCNGNSRLTKKEDSDWDLDIINFSKNVYSCEFLKFDKGLKSKNLHSILYGFNRF